MITIRHILCPVDFSEFSRRAVDHALALARWYDARLTLLNVFPSNPVVEVPPIGLEDDDRALLLVQMRQLAADAPADLQIDFTIHEARDVRREILAQITALDASLLVIGSHGRSGLEKLLLGSVTESLIRKAPCPVMVVPRRAADVSPSAPVRFNRILCPVDFSDGSLRALAWAFSLAQESDAHLTLMHAIVVPPELLEHPVSPDFNVDSVRAAAEAARLQRLRELIPETARKFCTVETTVQEGAPYREILRMAAEKSSDLIVMGVQGRGAIDLMVFGSNSYRVIRGAACPVLTVR